MRGAITRMPERSRSTLNRESMMRMPNFAAIFALMLTVVAASAAEDDHVSNSAREQIVKEYVLTIPLYVSVKQYYPAEFASIVGTIDPSKGFTDAIDARLRLNDFVAQKIPHASDEAVEAVVRAQLVEISSLRKMREDGVLCFSYLYEQRRWSWRLVSREAEAAHLSALESVLRTAAMAPQPVPQEKDISGDLRLAIESLREKYGKDVDNMVDDVYTAGIDRDKVCLMTSDLYSAILQLPSGNGGKVFRYLLAP